MIIADPKEPKDPKDPKDSAPPNTEKEPVSKTDFSGLFIIAGILGFIAVIAFYTGAI